MRFRRVAAAAAARLGGCSEPQHKALLLWFPHGRYQNCSAAPRLRGQRYFSESAPDSLPGVVVDEEDAVPTTDSIRLSKWISQHAGISRREAERLIKSGEVAVAGRVVTSPAATVPLSNLNGTSALTVSGKAVAVSSSSSSSSNKKQQQSDTAVNTRVWLVHKLNGELVTDSDPQDRPTIMQRLIDGGLGKCSGKKKKKQSRQHLKAIGRLDMNTEGLLLVTNDGDYARQMELPSNSVHRTYRVRTHGKFTQRKLDRIRSGLRIKNVYYAPMKVELEDTRKNSSSMNQWLTVTCAEGKNRQIRNVFQALGMKVSRLIRISYGDYQLQTIPKGMAIEVPVKSLNQQRRKGPLFSQKQRAPSNVVEPQATPPIQWVRSVR